MQPDTRVHKTFCASVILGVHLCPKGTLVCSNDNDINSDIFQEISVINAGKHKTKKTINGWLNVFGTYFHS